MKGDKIEVDMIPIRESLEQYWSSIWQDNTIFNEKADWLKDLSNTCSMNMVNNEYKINLQILENLIK